MKKILFISTAVFTLTVTQGQNIYTVAGNGTTIFSGDSGLATSAGVSAAQTVTFDVLGNMYIPDLNNYRIRIVNTSGIINTIAGIGTQGYSGDGGLATLAELNRPTDLAFDAFGNLFIADCDNARIRKINSSGIITTVAGNGMGGYSGDGGLATSAQLAYPISIVCDPIGNLYIADMTNNRVRKVDTSGIITTVVGNGTQGFSGDGGTATSAGLYYPSGVALDAIGNLYIGDQDNYRIRKVDTSGIITTVAGNGTWGYSGDGATATSAQLSFPTAVAIDASGNLIIADWGNSRVRMVNTSGIITTIAGNGTSGFSGDGGLATSAQIGGPTGVELNSSGCLFIGDPTNERIREVTLTNCPGVFSVQELSSNNNLIVSPNPFCTQTVLQVDIYLHSATLTVDNCFGQTVAQIKNISGQTVTFYRDNLPSGLYFVRLTELRSQPTVVSPKGEGWGEVIYTGKLIITD